MYFQPFRSWLHRRVESSAHIVSETDKVVLFVAQAGPQGMTRYKLGRSIKLEPQALDDLLDALVGFGLLTKSRQGEMQVFHAPHRASTASSTPNLL
jgi:hypothetical protein